MAEYQRAESALITPNLKTTSRNVARDFKKDHRKVLRSIRTIVEISPDWGMANFGHTPYVDEQNGQTYDMYEMTRDGFAMLVMGFTGDRAFKWKLKYLEAFNAMQAQIQEYHDQMQRNARYTLDDDIPKRLELVREARMLRGKAAAALLWERLGLPPIPEPAPSPVEQSVPWLAQFIKTHYVFTGDHHDRLRVMDIFADFKAWKDAPAQPLSDKMFGRALAKFMHEYTCPETGFAANRLKSNVMFYIGIARRHRVSAISEGDVQ